MEYVFDFMRLLSGNRGTGGARRRSGPGLALQLRLVFYGVLIGLMVPTLRKIDWSPLVPPGLKVEWPTGFGVTWPAGQLHVPGGWGRLRDTATDVAPSAAGLGSTAATAAVAAAGAAGGLIVGAGSGAGSGAGAGAVGAGKAVSARFTICGRAKRVNCMVDGDTFWMNRTKIRIADIDTPETHPPRCKAEARAGHRATLRMQALLNAGPFTLTRIKRDVDKYGRKLRLVQRDGRSLGDTLVREGLARRYGGGKRSPWC